MELINTRCTQGRLIITDTFISVELGQLRSETMARAAFVNLDSKLVAFPVFGFGGGSNLTFYGQGNKAIHADFVATKEVKKIKMLLTGR